MQTNFVLSSCITPRKEIVHVRVNKKLRRYRKVTHLSLCKRKCSGEHPITQTERGSYVWCPLPENKTMLYTSCAVQQTDTTPQNGIAVHAKRGVKLLRSFALVLLLICKVQNFSISFFYDKFIKFHLPSRDNSCWYSSYHTSQIYNLSSVFFKNIEQKWLHSLFDLVTMILLVKRIVMV